MQNSDAIILISEIRRGKKLSPRDMSIVSLCEVFARRGRPLSKAQAWALSAAYRRSQGAESKEYHERGYKA